MIESALMTKLNAIAGVTALVSTKIYFVKAPQDVTAPYLVIQKISAPRSHSYEGADGLVTSRWQFTAFATTYKSVKDIGDAIRAGLDGFTGLFGAVRVGYCLYDNETDLYDDDARLYGLAADYLINYTEV